MWLWIIATVVAFYIKGLCGFANTLVFTSILGFWENNVTISPVELVLGYPTNLILTWENRKELKKQIFIPLSVMVLVGSVPGVFMLKSVDSRIIKMIFGVVIILLGTEMYFRETKAANIKKSNVLFGLIGVMSGVLCGLFGVGALLAAYIGRVTETSSEFKANISAVFIVENTFRIILYSALGIITLDRIKQTMILVPFMLLGLFIGIKSGKVLDEKLIKRIVIILLIVSGIVLVAKNYNN